MVYRVEIALTAADDADAMLEWLSSEHAGKAALPWLESLIGAISALSKFPNRCPLAPEKVNLQFEVRQLFYGDAPNIYRIIFAIWGDVVQVLHIRHGLRQPEK